MLCSRSKIAVSKKFNCLSSSLHRVIVNTALPSPRVAMLDIYSVIPSLHCYESIYIPMMKADDKIHLNADVYLSLSDI